MSGDSRDDDKYSRTYIDTSLGTDKDRQIARSLSSLRLLGKEEMTTRDSGHLRNSTIYGPIWGHVTLKVKCHCDV